MADILLPSRVLEQLGGLQELVIVPNGPLALVPFAALVIDGDARPLGARVAVRYAPSLATLAQAEDRPKRPPSPTRSWWETPPCPAALRSAGSATHSRRYPAQEEASYIADRLRVRPLIGGLATESEVRKRLARASLVHLATHGFAYSAEAEGPPVVRGAGARLAS